MKTALIVDISNLYINTRRCFGNYRINFTRYLQELKNEGHQITHMYAYSSQSYEHAIPFAYMLKSIGFQAMFGHVSWNVEMALQLGRIAPQIECLVLGSAYSELGRLFKFSKERGIVCKCYATDIPKFFKDLAICKEITKDILDEMQYETPETTEQQELCSNVNGNAT